MCTKTHQDFCRSSENILIFACNFININRNHVNFFQEKKPYSPLLSVPTLFSLKKKITICCCM